MSDDHFYLQNTDYQIIYLKFCKLTIFDVIDCVESSTFPSCLVLLTFWRVINLINYIYKGPLILRKIVFISQNTNWKTKRIFTLKTP